MIFCKISYRKHISYHDNLVTRDFLGEHIYYHGRIVSSPKARNRLISSASSKVGMALKSPKTHQGISEEPTKLLKQPRSNSQYKCEARKQMKLPYSHLSPVSWLYKKFAEQKHLQHDSPQNIVPAQPYSTTKMVFLNRILPLFLHFCFLAKQS